MYNLRKISVKKILKFVLDRKRSTVDNPSPIFNIAANRLKNRNFRLKRAHMRRRGLPNGFKITISGRIRPGADMAKNYEISYGRLSLQSVSKGPVRYAYKEIYTKWGVWGLRVYTANPHKPTR